MRAADLKIKNSKFNRKFTKAAFYPHNCLIYIPSLAFQKALKEKREGVNIEGTLIRKLKFADLESRDLNVESLNDQNA